MRWVMRVLREDISGLREDDCAPAERRRDCT